MTGLRRVGGGAHRGVFLVRARFEVVDYIRAVEIARPQSRMSAALLC